MAIRGRFIGLAIVSIVVIGILFLGSVPQATAETLTVKGFNRATKQETIPVADEKNALSALAEEAIETRHHL